MKSTLAYNAASLAGTGLGTVFRYFSYKKWVFLAGAPGAAVAAGEAAVSGVVDVTETSEAGPLLAGTVLAGPEDGLSLEDEFELLDTTLPTPGVRRR
jgi:hypothetical protein